VHDIAAILLLDSFQRSHRLPEVALYFADHESIMDFDEVRLSRILQEQLRPSSLIDCIIIVLNVIQMLTYSV
jgi:hypothetical protein